MIPSPIDIQDSYPKPARSHVWAQNSQKTELSTGSYFTKKRQSYLNYDQNNQRSTGQNKEGSRVSTRLRIPEKAQKKSSSKANFALIELADEDELRLVSQNSSVTVKEEPQ